MKEEEYYYLEPSYATSGLTTLAGKIVEIAKREYAGAVVSESGLDRIKDSLIFNAEALKKEHPRWKSPNIVVYYNDFTKSMHLNIDGWSFVGHRVTGFIH
jgi:hypothetical protein